MCWNQEVSLNTFLFSSFVLGLVIYNNTYTQYKIKEFKNVWWYLLFMSVISMQLAEFFVWRNTKNPFYNNLSSKLVFLIILIQPICSLMIISDNQVRNILLFIYSVTAIPYSINKFINYDFKTLVGPCGHLNWNLDVTNIIFAGWLFFFLFSFFYEQKFMYFAFGLITFLAIMYKYQYDKTSGSVWCWIVNSMSLYLAFYLLFYLPFYEKK
jgi:hypothetical protein